MSSESLDNKTIRPGSLKGYAYYYSGRKPAATEQIATASKKRRLPLKVIVLLVILGGLVALPLLRHDKSGADQTASQNNNQPISSNAAAVVTQPAKKVNHCEGVTQAKLIKISVSQRHLWACEAGKMAYDTPVITGLQHHPETETPLGTYKIYAKQTNTTLTGTDSRGTWRDPVYYWMPFLDNQYGTYGFHDATWRADNAFGNVSPDSEEASHGCVELPLASSKWLYEWAPVHTVVNVEA